jgi:hypothetical protein
MNKRNKKLLDILFNKTFVFYEENGHYHFECVIKKKENIEILKQYIYEIERKRN